jgi:hypothetical protein
MNICVSKGGIFMTSTQVAAHKAAEEHRANRANEAELRRHNQITEQLSQQQLEELIRSNKRNEALKAEANKNQRYATDTSYAGVVYKAATDRAISTERNKSSERIAGWSNAIAKDRLKLDQFLADLQQARTTSDIREATARMEKLRHDIEISLQELEFKAREQNNRDITTRVNNAATTIDTLFSSAEKITRSGKNAADAGRAVTSIVKDILNVVSGLGAIS